ncbi:MAG TPA: N-6 DNA methylase [Vicinamibacterales bacterium]|nr:N-6 DNA methylase [Vicinamibacterales bacterium]
MVPGVSGSLISGSFLESLTARTHVPPSLAAQIAAALRRGRASCGAASPTRALLQSGAEPIVRSLGFERSADVGERAPCIAATLAGDRAAVALLVAPFGVRLDPLWPVAVVEARRRRAEWALLYNGIALRLVDATRLHARRHLDFDLDLASASGGIAALALTIAASALGHGGAGSTRALVAASDAHGSAVCRSLRNGVLDASAGVLEALVAARRRRPPAMRDSFEQALTIVYRLLFLLFAEARALVPLWHPVYRDSYSVEALRAAAEQPAGAPGLWDALRAMTRLAHAGCDAGDLRVTPFNGRLFAPSRTPLAERRDLDDEQAKRAVLALSTRAIRANGSRERITYRDLGVEQLGAVYETLLDYEPHVADGHVTLRPESGVRHATGTFYTPQPIAESLVRRTLAPLVRGRTPDEILQLRIVDPSMGSGAFLVAACRYLADAWEAAAVSAGDLVPGDVGDAERALIRRRVAERCLYGVDVNPMAVQLARLSLWLATLAADRPLSFLDHRLMTGDSLAGAWLAQLRRPPRARRSPASRGPTLFDADAVVDALCEGVPRRFSLESMPNDTLAQVKAKEHAHAAAVGRDAALGRWKRVADAWCATWFSRAVPPPAFTAVADAILHGSGSLPPKTADAYLAAAAASAATHQFFHWELECPEAFFDANGARLANPGFDAVLGNPPWNIVHADAAPLLRFARESGAYVANGQGHANRYQLFVERAIALTRGGGRVGLVLPWGFAADHGSAALRRFVTSRADIDAIVAIDNTRGIFPIHRSVRFVLVSATTGTPTREIACTLGVDDPATLDSVDDEAAPPGAVRLSIAALERLSGRTLAVPYVRTPTDLAIVERAATLFPALGDARGWGATFGRELNATDDRALFRPRGHGWPLVDGRHVSPFRTAVDEAERAVWPSDVRRAFPDGRCERPRLAYRDVASATNRTTLIAAMLPPRCVSTHTLFCLRSSLAARDQQFLCGLFNSLVLNFLVRLRVTTHVTTAIVEQLPVPPWNRAPRAAAEIAALARVLAHGDRADAFARLNALVASVYQLTESEFQRVLDSFPLIDRAERDRAFDAFVTKRR